MNHSSTIRAFQKILTTFKFDEPASFPEEFAIKRFLKKMELPDSSKAKLRREACFETWFNFDQSLTLPVLLPGNWYKARLLIHKWCEDFRLGPVEFTNGSETTSTRGRNSIESKLMRSKWECSPENWDLWARTAYETLAIKRSTRRRFSATMLNDVHAIQSFHKESYRMFAGRKDYKFLCFARMLSRVTMVCEASRFSTVRKNNEVDRPIDVQPLCNMLVQRRIGNGFRELLLVHGVDLDTLANKHRQMIAIRGFSTIDLKNASDSILISLIRFLFPKKVFSLLESSRLFFVKAPNGDYVVPRKISSMGNGFTFELMTIVIRALGLQYDASFSVYGDDIIIRDDCALDLIKDLNAVGFVVNDQKSFIASPFRESCGGNYHDDFGYVESYDFEYPETLHDCAVLNNKAYALSVKYPQFKRLYGLLSRSVPKSLQGPAFVYETNDETQGYDPQINLSVHFWSKTIGGCQVSAQRFARQLRDLCYDPMSFKLIYGLKYKPEVASRRVGSLSMRRHTGKYFMYLHGGRITDDVVKDRGSWQLVAYLTDGRTLLRAKSLMS